MRSGLFVEFLTIFPLVWWCGVDVVEGKWLSWNFQSCQTRQLNDCGGSTKVEHTFPEIPWLYLSDS
jgi:hypothetical protein